MSSVTLIGEHLAEVGQEFVYGGGVDACADCPYQRQCLNLETGNSYRVTSVREGAQRLPCAVHEGDVIAVEVEPTTVEMNFPTRQSLSGNKASLAGECPHVECASHALCVPDGMSMSEEYRVVEVLGDPPHEECALDRQLTKVEVSQE